MEPPGRFRTYTNMVDGIWLILIVAAYFALMRWVLPRFGVPT